MSELNEIQQHIADTLDGMMVVDAGPGTGKTHTIVARYMNILTERNVSPSDIMLLTFTNNAAAEMDERIRNKMVEKGMERDSKLVRTMTFDAFCLSIVLDSPDMIGEFFRFDESLTRSAVLSQNGAMNRNYFIRFMDGFLLRKGSDYGDYAVIASERPLTIMKLIQNLMSKGLIPLRKGWFGNDWKRMLEGDCEAVLEQLKERNIPRSRGASPNVSRLNDIKTDRYDFPEPDLDGSFPDEVLLEAASPDRQGLFDFIHDVYYEYIRTSIRDNRLTFGLNAMLAFVVLYSKPSVRERNSFRYVMIDEFQDTNANQMMIAMMILKEPNLAVLGDWKQGIYGFRHVSIENITDFERKLVEYRRFLNDDIKRIGYSIPEVDTPRLNINYRSSRKVIDTAFRAMCLNGSKDDNPR